MKKLICIMTVLLLLLCPLTLAIGPDRDTGRPAGVGDDGDDDTEDNHEDEDDDNGPPPSVQERNQFRNELREHNSEVTGLENAMLRVRNEEVKQHLESVMNKIQTRTQERLNEKEDLEVEETIEGDYQVKFKDNARFLGLLKMQRTFTYNLGEDGQLQVQKGPWDFLWKQVDLDPLEEE
jgi:hypothetical protein